MKCLQFLPSNGLKSILKVNVLFISAQLSVLLTFLHIILSNWLKVGLEYFFVVVVSEAQTAFMSAEDFVDRKFYTTLGVVQIMLISTVTPYPAHIQKATHHVMMLQFSFSPPQRPASSIKMDIFYKGSLWTSADSFQPWTAKCMCFSNPQWNKC